MVLRDGVVAGTWSKNLVKDKMKIDFEGFQKIPLSRQREFREACAKPTRFEGLVTSNVNQQQV